MCMYDLSQIVTSQEVHEVHHTADTGRCFPTWDDNLASQRLNSYSEEFLGLPVMEYES